MVSYVTISEIVQEVMRAADTVHIEAIQPTLPKSHSVSNEPVIGD